MKKVILGIFLLVSLGALTVSWRAFTTERPRSVITVPVERGSVTAHLSATGSVIDREELAVSSPVIAQIRRLHVVEGDRVDKGQILASFDDRESLVQIEKARAQLELAERNQTDARRNRDGLLQIFAVGGESRKTVDDAELRWQTTRRDAEIARQELRLAHVEHERFRVISPLAGTIISCSARNGAWTRSGDPLFRLAPSGAREIEAKIDAGDSSAAVVGKAVAVTSDAFPGKEWAEKITWVAPTTNKEGTANTLTFRVSLGQARPLLVLGQQVDIRLSTESRDVVLRIPSNATISKQGKTFVAVVVGHRIHLLPIQTGIGNLNHTEVTSGLRLGQRIILPEGSVLSEGEEVKVADNRES